MLPSLVCLPQVGGARRSRPRPRPRWRETRRAFVNDGSVLCEFTLFSQHDGGWRAGDVTWRRLSRWGGTLADVTKPRDVKLDPEDAGPCAGGWTPVHIVDPAGDLSVRLALVRPRRAQPPQAWLALSGPETHTPLGSASSTVGMAQEQQWWA